MRAAARHRRTGATLALAAAIAGCVTGNSGAILTPAGSHDDDGAGQLARASVQVDTDKGFDDLPASSTSPRRPRPEPRPWSGAQAVYGGSVYGLDTAFGGSFYGFGVGHLGIAGPSTPPRTDGGQAAVLGTVSWRGDRGVAWPAGCAGARVARAGGAAAGAIVYLANAPLRRDRFDDERWTTARGAIEADGCALWPPAQMIGPVPGAVDVENGGGEPLALSFGGPQVTLEAGGTWRLPMVDLSVVRLDAGRRAPAWILGQNHDYHTVTDTMGRFALDDVPAGSYELVVWYPPLVRAVDGDRPVWTEPTVLRRRVTVGASGTVRLALALDPAP